MNLQRVYFWICSGPCRKRDFAAGDITKLNLQRVICQKCISSRSMCGFCAGRIAKLNLQRVYVWFCSRLFCQSQFAAGLCLNLQRYTCWFLNLCLRWYVWFINLLWGAFETKGVKMAVCWVELGGLAGHSQQLIEEIHFGQKRTGEDGLTDHKILILIWKSLERQCRVNYGYHR